MAQSFGTMSGLNQANIAVRFSVRVTSASVTATRHTILRINFGLNETLSVRVQYNASNFDVDATGTNGVTTATTSEVTGLAYDTWHNVVIRTAIIAANDAITLRVNSTTVTTTGDWADGNAVSVDFGFINNDGATREAFFDDIIIDDSNVDINDSRSLIFLEPSADRATVQWTTVGAGASHTARVIDEDDLTGVGGGGTTAEIEELEMSDISGTMPAAFVARQFYGSCRHGHLLDNIPFTYRMRDSANNSEGSVSVAASSTLALKRSVLLIDSSTQSQTDLNGWYFRFETAAGLAVDQAIIWEAWAYVEVEILAQPTDTITSSEAVTITNTFTASETITATETTPITNVFTTSDNLSSSESAAIINTFTVTDTTTASETSEAIIYTTGGGGTTVIIQVNE